MDRPFDIVLMGATSFVGSITAKRFMQFLSSNPNSCRVAFAARSEIKLTQLLGDLETIAPNVKPGILVADSMNQDDMTRVAQAAKVVISTVGPYERYGEALVRACVEQGTHYGDLTGEPLFIKKMLARYEQTARSTGACIVHCCGFDSLPSDLGAFHLQQEAQRQFQQPCSRIDMRVKVMKGGLSGGTFASMIDMVQLARQSRDVRRVLVDPYALCASPRAVKQPFVATAKKVENSSEWQAPFLMATINSKIVLRSAELLPDLYPPNFAYSEAVSTGRGWKGRQSAYLTSFGLGGLTLGLAIAPFRWVLQKFLPKPGQGPSEQEQRDGLFIIDHIGRTESGKTITVRVKGDEDPGYGSTSKMLVQAALALLEVSETNPAGGFWTPAALLGNILIKRLPEAGVTIEQVTPS